ncbi:MAG: YdcF family protein, partial [Burkholderiales bacterium]
MDLLLWRKVLAAIVLPPIGPLLVLVVGALVLGRWPRLGRGLVWTGIAALVLLSTGIVARGLLWAVEVSPTLRLEDARTAQAIVILGGGVREAPEYGGGTVARL